MIQVCFREILSALATPLTEFNLNLSWVWYSMSAQNQVMIQLFFEQWPSTKFKSSFTKRGRARKFDPSHPQGHTPGLGDHNTVQLEQIFASKKFYKRTGTYKHTHIYHSIYLITYCAISMFQSSTLVCSEALHIRMWCWDLSSARVGGVKVDKHFLKNIVHRFTGLLEIMWSDFSTLLRVE